MTISIPSQPSQTILELPRSNMVDAHQISLHNLNIPFNRIRIAHGSFGLLQLFARITRQIQGIVCAAVTLDTPSCLINWITPVRDHSLIEHGPDWDDLRRKRTRLRDDGRNVIGEFHTSNQVSLTHRDKQNMQYHFFINQPHLQLIATPDEVVAYLFNGEEFHSRNLTP